MGMTTGIVLEGDLKGRVEATDRYHVIDGFFADGVVFYVLHDLLLFQMKKPPIKQPEAYLVITAKNGELFEELFD